MTTKYGVFEEPPRLAAGDPFVKHGTIDSRDQGLNLKATAPKTGKNNDATFDKFVSVHESDRYVDPGRRRLLLAAAKKKDNLTEVPFKYVSPMKQSACVGDYYATLGGKVSSGEPLDGRRSLRKGDVQHEPRPIYTNPPKKGTYGMNKFTISEKGAGYRGVSTEYEYQHDPETVHERQKVAEREAEMKARITELPFKPSNPTKKGGPGMATRTLGKVKGVVGEYEYVVGADPFYTRDPTDAITRAASAEGTSPFRPSNAHVEGNPFPEYYHDPEVPKIRAEAERRKQEAARLASTGPWKPNMSYKSDMCRSIVRMNC